LAGDRSGGGFGGEKTVLVEYGHGIHFRLLARFLHALWVIRKDLLPDQAICSLKVVKFVLFLAEPHLGGQRSPAPRRTNVARKERKERKERKGPVFRLSGVESTAGEA
jgi:hypothetical protein